ncbi:MAG: hypothetical protein LBS87_02855 [Puniceicoccales bacterium]|nr:hypothetical protein [Puniceicoccales bacterium]
MTKISFFTPKGHSIITKGRKVSYLNVNGANTSALNVIANEAVEWFNSFVSWTDKANAYVLNAFDYMSKGAKNITKYASEYIPTEIFLHAIPGISFMKGMWQSFLNTDSGSVISSFCSKHPAFAAGTTLFVLGGASPRGRLLFKHSLQASADICLLVPSMAWTVAKISLFAMRHTAIISVISTVLVYAFTKIKLNPELLD